MKLRAAQHHASLSFETCESVEYSSHPTTMAPHAGLGHLSSDDIVDSRKFLRKVFRRQLEEAEAGTRKLTVAGEQSLQHLPCIASCSNKSLAKKLETAEHKLPPLWPSALPDSTT